MSFLKDFWDAFTGKSLAGKFRAIYEPKTEELTLDPDVIAEKLRQLTAVTPAQWGEYALRRDLMYRRLSPEQKPRLIAAANTCGRESAQKLAQTHNVSDAAALAEALGVEVTYVNRPAEVNRFLFAEFVEPNQIRLNQDAISRVEAILEMEAVQAVIPGLQVQQVLLAHELFHFVEERDKNIFTHQKVELASGGLQKRAVITALSEIAAMAFAETLTELPCSPYVMDFLLLLGYQQSGALTLHKSILDNL